jgi:hypothetical protein
MKDFLEAIGLLILVGEIIPVFLWTIYITTMTLKNQQSPVYVRDVLHNFELIGLGYIFVPFLNYVCWLCWVVFTIGDTKFFKSAVKFFKNTYKSASDSKIIERIMNIKIRK